MSTNGLDQANVVRDRRAQYDQKLEEFRAAIQSQEVGCVQHGNTAQIETGRKFDKVYINTGSQNMSRYMVDRNSWEIFGVKSWAQINPRRWYGTLETVGEYDWSSYYGKPKSGTASEAEHNKREADIQQNYSPRGRPRKS